MLWLDVEMAWLGLGGPILRCKNVVRESYTHLVGASFLAVKLVWAQK